ncbi:MAG: hypothetical protein HRS50_02285, partial [Mycoplasmataceae bacterium]|nr:hypothetical protein [Mycoplasmataceae bacterium]
MNIKNKKIIAITGCAAGIAHTFMAAEGIENGAKELGAIVKVETHGTAGHDNVLTAKEIREADLVIIAADIAVDKTRFVGKLLFDTNTHLAIANPTKLIKEAFEKSSKYKIQLKNNNSDVSISDTGNIQKEGKVLKHIMFSLSWMVPLVIAGGLVMAVGNIFAMQPGWVLTTGLNFNGILQDPSDYTNVENGIYILQSVLDNFPEILDNLKEGLWWKIPNLINYVTVVVDGTSSPGLDYVSVNGAIFEWGKVWSFHNREFFNTLFSGGIAAMSLIYPVIAAALAYSIAGKLSFVPAFLGGWLMNDGNFLGLEINGTPFGTGFLGALVIGFFVGYMSLQLRKIKINRNFKGLVDLMVWPFLMSLIVVISSRYLLGPILGFVSLQMFNGIIWIGNIPGGSILLSAIIAAMICTDLGGPINKTALVAGTAIYLTSQGTSMNPNDWNFVSITATQAAISIPPLTAFMSVVLFPKYFTKQEKTLGTNASFMGLVGITEGAIPFAVAKPKIFIPANMIGGAISGMLVTTFGFQFYGGLGSPLAPVLGYVPSTVISNYFLGALVWALCYAIGVAVAVMVVALGLAIVFKNQKKSRLVFEIKSKTKQSNKIIKNDIKKENDISKIDSMNLKINENKTKLKNDILNIKKTTEIQNSKFKFKIQNINSK